MKKKQQQICEYWRLTVSVSFVDRSVAKWYSRQYRRLPVKVLRMSAEGALPLQTLVWPPVQHWSSSVSVPADVARGVPEDRATSLGPLWEGDETFPSEHRRLYEIALCGSLRIVAMERSLVGGHVPEWIQPSEGYQCDASGGEWEWDKTTPERTGKRLCCEYGELPESD